MKKSYVIVILLFAVCFFVTACLSNENIQKKSETNAATQRPEETETVTATQRPEETDELGAWLKQYKAFLQDRVPSEEKEDREFYYLTLTDYCNTVVPGETEDGIQYALFDMTGDGMPELHVLTDISYEIHTIKNHHLVVWYGGDRYNRPLNNRMILWKGDSESAGESYTVLDSEGKEVVFISFTRSFPTSRNDYGYFSTGDDDIKVSKKQWKKLRKPFLAIGSDKIIWKNIGDLDF